MNLSTEQVINYLQSSGWGCMRTDWSGNQVWQVRSPSKTVFLLPPEDYGDFENKLHTILMEIQRLNSPTLDEIREWIVVSNPVDIH